MDKYRHKVLSFNDDIQGTASVALAGLVSSLRLTSRAVGGCKTLRDHKFLVVGAGEAGVGIAELVADSISRTEGISKEEARTKMWLVDSQGLVCSNRGVQTLQHHKQPYAHACPEGLDFKNTNLADICRSVGATAIIGVSAQPQTFTQQVCEQMARNCQRPVIFALSNPTEKAECTAEQAIRWTKGQCMFCSGSPFDNVEFEGRSIRIGQANNAYIFPGLALGVLSAQVGSIPDELLETAAFALADQVTEEDLQSGSLFPPLSEIRKVSAKIAAGVASKAYEMNLAELHPRPADLEKYCADQMYSPKY